MVVFPKSCLCCPIYLVVSCNFDGTSSVELL